MSQILLKQFQSDKQLTRTLFNNFGKVLVFLFYAEWNASSKKFKDNFSHALSFFGQFDNVQYYAISAQKCPETFKKYNVQYTPTVIFTQTDKKILKKIEGNDVSLVFDSLAEQSRESSEQFEKQKSIWHPKIKSILNSCPVIVFIKGTPNEPKCGFTQTLLNILKNNSIDYTYYDIIADQYMRYWLRNYSNWPTYPQIYVQGKIVGGLDVLKEQISNGQFLQKVPASCKTLPAQQKYELMIKDYPNLIITPSFTFESKQIQKWVEQIRAKSENELTIVNAGLDTKLLSYLKSKQISIPVWILNGQPKN